MREEHMRDEQVKNADKKEETERRNEKELKKETAARTPAGTAERFPLPPFRQELYGNGYFRQVELAFGDCDRNKRARIGTLLTILAAFGGYDYDARGLTHEKLWDMRSVFLFSRAAVRIRRCPVYRERLDVRTWEGGPSGPHMRRVYELRDGKGELCVSAKSDWILVDPESRKILRPASFTAHSPGPCPVEIECPEPKKLRLPRGDVE